MVVTPLSRKLLRDLEHLRGQVLSIALVVACGIASFVTLRSAYDSLIVSRDAYYERYRFADVFIHLERAPRAVEERIQALPGVAMVETRIVDTVTLPMPGMLTPARATAVSLPSRGQPRLNAVHLEAGRLPQANGSDEVVVLQSFAEAHGLAPGDTIPAIVNGTRRELDVVGVGMSPEFVLTMAPGEMTFDPKRTATLWMPEESSGAAFRMEGAFNDVAVRLQPGASEAAVLSALDDLLRPYGSLGAVGRARQPSHFMLSGELTGLENMATTLPFIFLAVAAFLVNVVLSRLVYLQRAEIATLKAVGYRDRDVGVHYLMLVGVIGLLGAVVGLALGAWLGAALMDLYTGEYFRFPDPVYHLDPRVAVTAVGVSLGAAVVGAIVSVRSVTALPPAEAMRPPAPASYQRTFIRSGTVSRLVGPATRMALRELERRPARTLLSTVGIALAVGILVAGRFMYDSVEQLMYVHFERAMLEDVTVLFLRPVPERAVRELAHLPGVRDAEGLRAVAVRFQSGHRHRDATLNGYPEGSRLRRLLDKDGRIVRLPRDGVMLTSTLGEILGVGVGDEVEVHVREGDRRTLTLSVSALVDESFGLQGHMTMGALRHALGEAPVVTTGLLSVAPTHSDAVHERLRKLPWVMGVSSPSDFKRQFEDQSGSMMIVFTLIITIFASVIAIGIVYNNARIALSQRSRDLASLRVLGFRQAEIARILFSELAVQVLLAIPLGLVIGGYMAEGMMAGADPEVYRFPIVISERTYAFATVIALASAVVSGLLVRRKLWQLDLIAVLKTRQ